MIPGHTRFSPDHFNQKKGQVQHLPKLLAFVPRAVPPSVFDHLLCWRIALFPACSQRFAAHIISVLGNTGGSNDWEGHYCTKVLL